jgi:HEAT repeat protein
MTDNNRLSTGMRARKQDVIDILAKRDFDQLKLWAKQTRNPLRIMNSLLFESDPLICYRALEGLGIIAALKAEGNLENLRKLIRRFFWMMNDESGNIGWYAAEAIGEILRNVPELIAEYGHMLPQFLVEEPFEKGARIAIARVAEIDKSCFDIPVIKKLIQTLDDPDPYIRSTSIIALKALGAEEAREHINALADDKAVISLYDFKTGELSSITIEMLAKRF